MPESGPVLVYLAEDALAVVRERIEGMARHRGIDITEVEIHVITAPTLRLDRNRDGTRLGRQPGGSGPGCSFSIPWCGFTASTRTMLARWPSCWRTFVRCNGSSIYRFCWCITRERMPGVVAPPARGCRGST